MLDRLSIVNKYKPLYLLALLLLQVHYLHIVPSQFEVVSLPWPVCKCFFVRIAYFFPDWVAKFSPQRLWCRKCYLITSSTFSLVDTRHFCRAMVQEQHINENLVIQAVIGVIRDYGFSRLMQQRTDGGPVLPIKMLVMSVFW